MNIKKNKIVLLALAALLLYGGVLFAEDSGSSQSMGYIDVHMHLAANRQNNQGEGQGKRRKKGMKAQSQPQKDYEPAAIELISMMDELGVKKVVVMPPPQAKGQKGRSTYEEFIETVERHRDRLAFAAGGDYLNPMIMAIDATDVMPPMKKKFREMALRIIEDGAVGFGEMTALHFSFSKTHVFEQAQADHPLFLLLSDIAAEHRLPIDLHIEAVLEDQVLPTALSKISPNNPATIKATIPGFERLLDHNPKTNIVWQHVGWDNTGHMTTVLVRRLLKAHPNLYCALKFVQKEHETFQLGEGLMDENLKIRSKWLELISEFPDRFMIGADDFISAPGSWSAGPPSFIDTWAIIDQLPEELRDKVGRENAARVYRINK